MTTTYNMCRLVFRTTPPAPHVEVPPVLIRPPTGARHLTRWMAKHASPPTSPRGPAALYVQKSLPLVAVVDVDFEDLEVVVKRSREDPPPPVPPVDGNDKKKKVMGKQTKLTDCFLKK